MCLCGIETQAARLIVKGNKIYTVLNIQYLF